MDSQMNLNNKKVLMLKIDITAKFTIAIVLGVFLLMFVGNSLTFNEQQKELDGLLKSSNQTLTSITQIVENTSRVSEKKKIERQIALLKKIAASPIANLELDVLNEFAKVTIKDPNISYLGFTNKDGKILSSKGNSKVAGVQILKDEIKTEGILLGYIHIHYRYNELNKFIKSLKVIQANSVSQLKQAGSKLSSHTQLISIISTVAIGVCLTVMIIFLFKLMVTKRLSILESNLDDVAHGDGDLTKRIDESSSDIIGRIGSHYNTFVEKIRMTVTEVVAATSQLKSSSEQMRVQTEEAHTGLRSQNQEIDQAATAITEMSATVQEVARNAATAADAATSADNESREGMTIVRSTIQSIDELSNEVNSASEVINKLEKDSESIGAILDVIRGIAEQTNLLALNAAIEAARAGEQGRGFAVVADEVRTLASRTQKSTEEIHNMISLLQQGTANAVKVMEEGRSKASRSVEMAEKAGNSLQSITAAVSTITEMNTQIASAAEEQGAVSEEINRNILSVRELSINSTESFQATADSGEVLNGLAGTLEGLVSRFKV
ncbi:Methyl-accepting chemotaxis sensor/transducer protein [hydrothermal vent metagenome]|uniref:Methyl-accepting chemotaxis sensor/transducer protein n=1 Tax=hydrothermal vent metagenome TaxID=652676 RepID=A0A3B0XT23_9ZZZZ